MLPSGETLIVFATATAAVLVLPGPSVVYVMTRSIEQGRSAGLLAMLGLETGALLHVAGATAGLASVLAASPVAYSCIRYVGAGYLLYLAVRQLRPYVHAGDHGGLDRATRWRLYRDGVLVDLLNPKTCLFFVAFLPQFLDRSGGSVSGQMLVLGLCFVILAVLCDGTYALVSGGIGTRLRGSVRLHRRVNRATGGVYVMLAVAALAY